MQCDIHLQLDYKFYCNSTSFGGIWTSKCWKSQRNQAFYIESSLRTLHFRPLRYLCARISDSKNRCEPWNGMWHPYNKIRCPCRAFPEMPGFPHFPFLHYPSNEFSTFWIMSSSHGHQHSQSCHAPHGRARGHARARASEWWPINPTFFLSSRSCYKFYALSLLRRPIPGFAEAGCPENYFWYPGEEPVASSMSMIRLQTTVAPAPSKRGSDHIKRISELIWVWDSL